VYVINIRVHSLKSNFFLYKKEIEIRNWSKQYFTNMGMNVCERFINNGADLSFGNMPLRNFFHSFKHRTEKCLPHNFIFLPKEKQLQIVIGWALGDGCFYRQKIHWSINK